MATEKEQIVELLKKRNLTSAQLFEETGIKKEHLYVYLNELLKENKVCRLDDKKPYTYFAVECFEYLKFLNEFFKNNIDHLLKDLSIDTFIEENEEIFNKIERVINNA